MNIRMTARRWFHRLLSAPCHILLGRLALARRALAPAKAHFRQVLDVNPEHFGAHVLLARVALLENDESEAFRGLLAARRIDPRRFARLALGDAYGLFVAGDFAAHSDPLLEDGFAMPSYGERGADARVARNGFESTGGRTFPGARRPGGVTRPATGDVESASEPLAAPGDFSSRDEALRFKDLPPITRDDIAGIDWERVDSRAFDRDPSA